MGETSLLEAVSGGGEILINDEQWCIATRLFIYQNKASALLHLIKAGRFIVLTEMVFVLLF